MLKKLASLKLFYLLAALLIVAMTAGTLIPQNQPVEKYQEMFSAGMYKFFSAAGFLNLFHSAWFTGLLVLLGVNTTACIAMRLTERKFKNLPWGALTSHAAILVIMVGGVVSAVVGQKGILEMRAGEQNCCVPSTSSKGGTIHLPFQVRLTEFRIEYYNEGQHYLQIADRNDGWSETLEVAPGGQYQIRDNSVKVRVLQHLPDFRADNSGADKAHRFYSASSRPNNPALEVELTASPARKMWVFANHPGFSHDPQDRFNVLYQFVPGKIKQFKSKVEILERSEEKDPKVLFSGETFVNHPLKFGGYTFYQSGYNPDDPDYSSFQVAKDPGVGLVYAGFLLLPLGLTISYYGKGGKKNERANS